MPRAALLACLRRAAPLLMLAVASASEVRLRTPLTTLVERRGGPCPHGVEVVATVQVPADAPRDLGVGGWIADRHGRWWQRPRPGALRPGTHELRFVFEDVGAIAGEGHRATWSPAQAATASQGGLFFWSADAGNVVVQVRDLRLTALPAPRPAAGRLLDLDPGGVARTGERWELRVRPDPYPANPYDPDEFSLEAVVALPGGGEQRVAGFHCQPMAASDRGDCEELRPLGAAAFHVRLRPRVAGAHRVTLEARWKGQAPLRVALQPIAVAGAAWDGHVRVDRGDPRFLATGDGALYWPIGVNLRSVWDLRGQDRTGSALTPNRGALAYRAYLERFAAGGATACEIWMSAWNLALEWRPDPPPTGDHPPMPGWPDYHGQGRYSEANACRLERVLDDAWRLGMRVNLVVNNHGQASERTDREWHNNPYAREAGGKLDQASQFFTDPWALAGQERLRRYLVARWGDHPAIMGWKLWSEVNLTAGQRDDVIAWHQQAAARWHALDGSGRGVTTHWSGDYRTPDPAVAALPGLDYLCIDAYHAPAAEGGPVLADLLWQSLHNPSRGLSRYGKPVLVTEFGGNWNACPEPQLLAEHASGAWAALVSGHAGAPMLWWFEWVDQGARFQPYAAVARFIAGEELRGTAARSVELAARSGAGALWCRAWSRPGRLLAYVIDLRWGGGGDESAQHAGATIDIGQSIAPGPIAVEWWDADRGRRLAEQRIEHRGGPLAITAPAFRRHLAFKLARLAP